MSGAQLTTLSFELDGSDVTIGPASGPHLVIHDGTKLAVAVLKPATPAVGATFTDTRAWIGVKATDVGASLEGIDGLDAVDHRRQLLLQQRLRGA